MKNEFRLNGLNSDLKAFLYDLDDTIKLLWKREIQITSGIRTYAEQKKHWDDRKNNPYPVGHPDQPLTHYTGDAVDVSVIEFKPLWNIFYATVKGVMKRHPAVRWGADWKDFDPVHFYTTPRGGITSWFFAMAGAWLVFRYLKKSK